MEMPATRWRLIFGECGALQRWGKPSRSCNERERQALDHTLGDDARRTAIVATSMGAPPEGGGVPGENLGMDPWWTQGWSAVSNELPLPGFQMNERTGGPRAQAALLLCWRRPAEPPSVKDRWKRHAMRMGCCTAPGWFQTSRWARVHGASSPGGNPGSLLGWRQFLTEQPLPGEGIMNGAYSPCGVQEQAGTPRRAVPYEEPYDGPLVGASRHENDR